MLELFDLSLLTTPRRKSILARYRRKTKLMATAILFAMTVLPPMWIYYRLHHITATGTNMTSDVADNVMSTGTDTNMTVDQTDINAQALNDQDDRTIKLADAPDSRLTEETTQGSLPRIGEDGAQPWRAYARPFNTADRRPRIAIIVTGLGMAREITDETINQLPPTVTLGFNGEDNLIGAWVTRARQDGHEALLDIPMEPFDFPHSDPGPDTLLGSLPNSDNICRLYNVMKRGSGYIGILSTSGSRLTTDPEKLTPILNVLHDRGLMVVDARVAPHSVVTDLAHKASLPVATVTQHLDTDLAPAAIAAALNDLEKNATLSGRAVGITTATPVMIQQLQLWAKGLPQRGIALAPISALVK